MYRKLAHHQEAMKDLIMKTEAEGNLDPSVGLELMYLCTTE